MKEKILKSLVTSDLSSAEWENHAHVVAALGAAQIGNRHHLSIGAMLLHVKSGEHRLIPRILALTTSHVIARAKRDRWQGVTAQRAGVIVREALARFLDSNCKVCNGVGRIGEFGQVIVLCSRANGGCGGSGKMAENWKGWKERIKDVLSTFGAWEGSASARTRTKARGPRLR